MTRRQWQDGACCALSTAPLPLAVSTHSVPPFAPPLPQPCSRSCLLLCRCLGCVRSRGCGRGARKQRRWQAARALATASCNRAWLQQHAFGSLATHLRLTCRVTGLVVEEVKVNVGKKEQRSPEFLAINPLGKVPALQVWREACVRW